MSDIMIWCSEWLSEIWRATLCRPQMIAWDMNWAPLRSDVMSDHMKVLPLWTPSDCMRYEWPPLADLIVHSGSGSGWYNGQQRQCAQAEWQKWFFALKPVNLPTCFNKVVKLFVKFWISSMMYEFSCQRSGNDFLGLPVLVKKKSGNQVQQASLETSGPVLDR